MMGKLIESLTCLGLAALLILSVMVGGWLVFSALDAAALALGGLP